MGKKQARQLMEGQIKKMNLQNTIPAHGLELAKFMVMPKTESGAES